MREKEKSILVLICEKKNTKKVLVIAIRENVSMFSQYFEFSFEFLEFNNFLNHFFERERKKKMHKIKNTINKY